MKAVLFEGGKIHIQDVAQPEAESGDLLVRVISAGINAADVSQLAGRYQVPPGVDSTRPGLELCGEVIECGSGVSRFAPGDVVMALVADKGQAEYIAVPESVAMPVPVRVDPRVAGGIPEAFVTAHDALFTQMEMALGDRVLIHGAAGGVGAAAVQLAVHAGGIVTGSSRNEALRPRIAELGARAVDPADVHRHGPYDVILESIGAPNIPGDIDSLDIGGRVCVIGVTAGNLAEVNLRTLMSKRGRISASTLRARSIAERAQAVSRADRSVSALFSAGRGIVPVEETFSLDRAEEAYARFSKGGKFGKVMLVMD